jgi:hypothetical protein
VLLLITIIGAVIRVNALSDYKFYPDSYQPLVVAENIKTSGAVLGYLGLNGMLYPGYFSWTRPLYPLLILLVSAFTSSTTAAARIISFALGVTAIPLSFLFIQKVWRDRFIALSGAMLVALSYVHSVWSGFIMTDTTAVFLLMLFLWLFFSRIDEPTEFGNWHDLLTGVVLLLAILCRYEYAVLVVPITIYVWLKNPRPIIKITNFFTANFIAGALAFTFLSPFYISFGNGASEITGLIGRTKPLSFGALPGFLIGDSIIAAFFASGTFLLVMRKKYSLLAFTLLSMLLLGFFYYQTNPNLIRYFVHLIPFMLIPATYGLYVFLIYARKSPHPLQLGLAGFIIMTLIWQFRFSYVGYHNKDNGIWYQKAYEDGASQTLGNLLKKNDIAIVSMPEPYFLESGNSIQSIIDKKPFVIIPETLNESNVVIVEDEGMRYLFPHFSRFLETRLSESLTNQIPYTAIFRYSDRIATSSPYISVYQLKLGELKKAINEL